MSNPSEPTIVADTPALANSILSLTEQEGNAGGFTIGLSLASFSSSGDGGMRLPVTDVVILALVNILREMPDFFKEELDKVNAAISDLSTALAEGEAVDEALAKFQAVTGVAGLVRT
ncbi:hypothetical protein BAJUN_02950 [Bajunvirus bajun]|uniref:Uncharacterized protein n=1 Tax=Brevundimonas phage vB_BgoS-Bajun TaxID=2948594 RepID=A0A9E7STF4_9CAUD|nr:hypothetical protein BAJUN_02950 [Brevundimonas phage vB_BgoS-Bajun]